MAYWIQEIHGNTNRKSFMCDNKSDIEKLPKYGIEGAEQEGDTVSPEPCLYGSDCFCLEDKSAWILGKEENEWIEI